MGDLVAETVSKVFVLDVEAFCDVVASSFDPIKAWKDRDGCFQR